MAIEGLLVIDDGTVQVIGQPKTLTVFIPYIEQLLGQLREREKEELKQSLSIMSDEELRAELDRRLATQQGDLLRTPPRRTQKLQEAE